MSSNTLVTIVGMALVTYMVRAGGLWLMGFVKPSPGVEAWLKGHPRRSDRLAGRTDRAGFWPARDAGSAGDGPGCGTYKKDAPGNCGRCCSGVGAAKGLLNEIETFQAISFRRITFLPTTPARAQTPPAQAPAATWTRASEQLRPLRAPLPILMQGIALAKRRDVVYGTIIRIMTQPCDMSWNRKTLVNPVQIIPYSS